MESIFIELATDTLTPAQIDWAIFSLSNNYAYNGQSEFIRYYPIKHNYCYDWLLAGPIIELAQINLSCPRGTYWSANMWVDKAHPITGHHIGAAADQILVAAMKCYVRSLFGNTVKIPIELENVV